MIGLPVPQVFWESGKSGKNIFLFKIKKLYYMGSYIFFEWTFLPLLPLFVIFLWNENVLIMSFSNEVFSPSCPASSSLSKRLLQGSLNIKLKEYFCKKFMLHYSHPPVRCTISCLNPFEIHCSNTCWLSSTEERRPNISF